MSQLIRRVSFVLKTRALTFFDIVYRFILGLHTAKGAKLLIITSLYLIFYIPNVFAGNLSNGSNTATSFQYPVIPTPDNPGLYHVGGYDFGTPEYDNSNNFIGYHNGQDVHAPAGTLVFASANGNIVYSAQRNDGWGWLIIVEHQLADGTWYYSLYGHLSSHRLTRNRGLGPVYRSEEIGTVSDADEFVDPRVGNCKSAGISCGTGPHLHFGIRQFDITKDPVKNKESGWCASITATSPTDYGWVNPKDFIDARSKTPITGKWAQGRPFSFGTYDTNTCVFTPDFGQPITFGSYGDVPVTGDWTGDGITKIGVFRPKDPDSQLSRFYLQGITSSIAFGTSTDWPIMGDWDGDGRDDIGVYRLGNFYLYNRNSGQTAPPVAFGQDVDIPITGDWNRDGRTEIGIFRRSNTTNQFYFDIGLTGGQAEYGPYEYGNVGDIPITGNWNGGGGDKIGVFRPSTGQFFPDNTIPNITESINGTCGSSSGGTFTSAPNTNLCSSGTASSVSGSGPWYWTCIGSNGGSTDSCSANIQASPINGTCGSSSGGTFTSAPTTNLCSSGTATSVTGNGPWYWSCSGSNGGTTASCSANIGSDDYPYRNECTYNASCPTCCVDPWNFYYRECTSFVAWRMNRDGGKVGFFNSIGGGHWGNAENWDTNAVSLTWLVNNTAAAGAIAQWNVSSAYPYGHVAYVEKVNPDGSVNISEYNRDGQHNYGGRDYISASSPSHYIHPRNDKFLTYIAPDATKVYWVQNNKKYWVNSADLLNKMKDANIPRWNWASVYSIEESYASGPDFISAGSSSNGLYIQRFPKGQYPAVYRITNGSKEHISFDACQSINCWDDIIEVSQSVLDMFSVAGTDTTVPTVNSFSISPASVAEGEAFTISYSVSDRGGSGLNRVELWRTTDNNGNPSTWPRSPVTSNPHTANGPISGLFSDTLPSAGIYWYGLHVVDNSTNWNDEKNSNSGGSPGIFGPIKTTVNQISVWSFLSFSNEQPLTPCSSLGNWICQLDRMCF